MAEGHLHLACHAAVDGEGEPLNLRVGGTCGHVTDAGRPVAVGGEGDAAFHLVPRHSLAQFALRDGDIAYNHVVIVGAGREAESEERNEGALAQKFTDILHINYFLIYLVK